MIDPHMMTHQTRRLTNNQHKQRKNEPKVHLEIEMIKAKRANENGNADAIMAKMDNFLEFGANNSI